MEARIFKECIAYKEKGDFIAIDYDSWRDGKPSSFGIPLKEVKKQEVSGRK